MTNGNGNGHHQDKPKYKFLFISLESLSGDLAWKIKNEGHEVKCYIKQVSDEYDGILEKVPEWKSLTDWADVIVFDDVGFEKKRISSAGPVKQWLAEANIRID